MKDSNCRKNNGEQEESPLTATKHEIIRNDNGQFAKGSSGNPGGRPVKYAKLKKALDKWADSEVMYDFWDLPHEVAKTIKEQVHWRIWHKSRQGCNKSIEILAKLGCLDDE